MLIKKISQEFPTEYTLQYTDLNLYFKDEYYYLGNNKKIYFETKDKKEMKTILTLVPEYIKEYNKFKSLLQTKNKIDVDNVYYIENNNNNFIMKRKIDDETIGSRLIIFPSLISYYFYGEIVTHGHSGLKPEYIGKGLGKQFYKKIDEFIELYSTPSSSPCMSYSTSKFALKMWDKIASERVVKGYSNIKEYDDNKIVFFDGMHKYLNLDSYKKDDIISFIDENKIIDCLKTLIKDIPKYKFYEEVTEEDFKELNEEDLKKLLEDFFLHYHKNVFHYVAIRHNNAEYKNIPEKIENILLNLSIQKSPSQREFSY